MAGPAKCLMSSHGRSHSTPRQAGHGVSGWLAGWRSRLAPASPGLAAGYDDAVPLPEEDEGVQHAVSLQHQNEQQQAQATAGNAAAEAELGDDVLGAGPSPPAQPSLAAQADVPPVGAAGPADATDDDLYADLAPVIPQTDGAADSPPRWRRHTDRADPGERWEMGAGGSGGLAWPGLAWRQGACCVPRSF